MRALLFFLLYTIGISAAHADVITKSEIVRVATEAASANGIEPAIVLAVIQVESSFNPRAVGPYNEIGLMQLHPKYFPGAEKLTPEERIHIGVQYLAYVRARCLADYGDAWVNCYNHGPNHRVKYPQEFPYYKRIMEALSRAR